MFWLDRAIRLIDEEGNKFCSWTFFFYFYFSHENGKIAQNVLINFLLKQQMRSKKKKLECAQNNWNLVFITDNYHTAVSERVSEWVIKMNLAP
jgi:hypothetical protein